MIRGDSLDANNQFHFDQARLNIPGQQGYDPSLPWVFKFRSCVGKIANDSFVYVDDVRTTGSTEAECWACSRAVASCYNFLGCSPKASRPFPRSQSLGRILSADLTWKRAMNCDFESMVESKSMVLSYLSSTSNLKVIEASWFTLVRHTRHWYHTLRVFILHWIHGNPTKMLKAGNYRTLCRYRSTMKITQAPLMRMLLSLSTPWNN